MNFLCVWPCAECFILIISFNILHNPILSQFYRWGNWGYRGNSLEVICWNRNSFKAVSYSFHHHNVQLLLLLSILSSKGIFPELHWECVHISFRAYGSSQARGQIGTAAAGLYYQPQQCRTWAVSATYTAAHGRAGSLTHWVGPGIEPESSGILVRFITSEPWWELLHIMFLNFYFAI